MSLLNEMYDSVKAEFISNTLKTGLAGSVLALSIYSAVLLDRAEKSAHDYLSSFPEYGEFLRYKSVASSLREAASLLTVRTHGTPSVTDYPEPGRSKKIMNDNLR